MVISILSNPSRYPYSNSLAILLVMGVASFVWASSPRSIHSHLRHSCWQKLMLKEEGSRRQMMYISDFPKAPGCSCCCRMLRMDLNSDLMPVSSNTSRTAVSPRWKEQTLQNIREQLNTLKTSSVWKICNSKCSLFCFVSCLECQPISFNTRIS